MFYMIIFTFVQIFFNLETYQYKQCNIGKFSIAGKFLDKEKIEQK